MWEQLVEIVSRETERQHDEIMLLRHSDARIEQIRRYGGSIEEYTAVQSIDSKFDFAKTDKPLIRLVVVIVDNSVYRVYAVSGIQAKGTNRNLHSNEINQMQIDLGRPEVPAQRFVITEVITSVVGKRIRGWEGEEGRPEARLGENSNAVRSESEMFFEIEVETENMGSVRVDSDDILKNALRKDFGKFPRGLQDIYFLLYDWLNGYDLEKRRSKNRDGSWGSTISFKLRGTEFYGLQISPAGDIHLRFNKQKFEAAGIFPKLEHAILKEIQPLSKQKPRGTGNNVTSTGIKIILTAHDSGLVDVIINQLSPLVDTVCGQAPSLKVE